MEHWTAPFEHVPVLFDGLEPPAAEAKQAVEEELRSSRQHPLRLELRHLLIQQEE